MLANAPGQVFHKILSLVGVALGHVADHLPGVPILQLVVVDQGHGVNFDEAVDDELHPRQADALGGELPPVEGGGRAGDVHHDFGAGLGHAGQIYRHGFVL
jgi:hypothetical protein